MKFLDMFVRGENEGIQFIQYRVQCFLTHTKDKLLVTDYLWLSLALVSPSRFVRFMVCCKGLFVLVSVYASYVRPNRLAS